MMSSKRYWKNSQILIQTRKDKHMNAAFEYITALEYRLKALKKELDAFRSDDRYLKIKEDSRKSIRSLERMLKERDQEICRCHQETIRVRNYWFEVFEDMQKEHLREIKNCRQKKRHLNSVP